MCEKISYSFKEKFLSIEKEKRIARRQFLSRLAIPGLIVFIPNIIFSILLFEYIVYLSLFFSIVYLIIIWILLPNIIIKRCHDFNSKGILEKNLLLGFISIYIILQNIIIISTYIIDIISYELIDLLIEGYEYLGFIILFIVVYLIIRKGNKGKNNYGDDTSNVKVGLFG